MSSDGDFGGTAECPSVPWRLLSSTTMLGVGALCRAFLLGVSRPEMNGLDSFLEILESRQDPSQRSKGLLTVSNHTSVPLALFFTMGQVLPTHRLAHSPYGGLAQPAVTQAIRLLSKGPHPVDAHLAAPERQKGSLQNVCVDPFSEVPTAYTTNGEDSHLAPSAYSCNSHSWLHIFPEGKIHQAPHKTMRYFKWGVARLILETSECPDIVPIWLEGLDQVMHESRKFPRFLPRPGKPISITFGDKVDTDAVFGNFRKRWQELRAKAEKNSSSARDLPLGVLNDELLYGEEAVQLRREVTKTVRDLVLDVRRTRGLPDEDPKEGLVETWIQEGPKREGKMADESWVRDI